MPVDFLLPIGRPASARDYGLMGVDLRSNARIAMLTNGFPGGDAYLRRQAHALVGHIPSLTFRHETKGAEDQLSAAVSDELRDAIASDCDAVVIAWGHCGSCTSGVTRDAIKFYDKGIPSVSLICEPFWDYAAWLGEAMGLTGIPRLKLPYPVAGTPEQSQNELARRLAHEIISAIGRA